MILFIVRLWNNLLKICQNKENYVNKCRKIKKDEKN